MCVCVCVCVCLCVCVCVLNFLFLDNIFHLNVHYVCMLVQRFEPQGRRFTNFHYYYYYSIVTCRHCGGTCCSFRALSWCPGPAHRRRGLGMQRLSTPGVHIQEAGSLTELGTLNK